MLATFLDDHVSAAPRTRQLYSAGYTFGTQTSTDSFMFVPIEQSEVIGGEKRCSLNT